MEHTDIYTQKIEDFNREQLLPGFSDTQNTPGRMEGEEGVLQSDGKRQETKQISFDPYDRKKK
jgi:hypothetical protein